MMRVPGIRYVQGRNDYTDHDGLKFGIAIHNTSNDASDEGEASYAQRRTDGVSSHFYVDRDSITQSIDTVDRVGHAGSNTGNNNAIAVEITGGNGWSRATWLASVAWDELGRVLAYVIKNDPDYRGFQVRRATVVEMKSNPRVKAFYGHNDMRLAWGGTTHTDPGPNFPWDRLFAAVNSHLNGDIDMTPAEKKQLDDMSWQVRNVPAPDGTRRVLTGAVSLLVQEVVALKKVVAGLGAASPLTEQQLAALMAAAEQEAREEVAEALTRAAAAAGSEG